MDDYKYCDGAIWKNSIDHGDDPSGIHGGYTKNGNIILPDAMMEIVRLREALDHIARAHESFTENDLRKYAARTLLKGKYDSDDDH